MTKIMSPLNWQRFFRSRTSDNRLFGRNLPTTGSLPIPVINMLRQLYLKGPFTVGIFRKSANARICREVEAQLEEDQEYCLDEVPITVVGSVFKDFLRSLPNCLLDSRLLNKWIEAVSSGSPSDQRESVDKLLKKLPAENLLLLKHVLCLLWHIAQHSSVNKMCPSNLAVCIGPSLLSSSKIISPVRREEVSKNVPKVISYLIDHCPDLFGESVLTLLGPELEPVRPDSGAEVSDSSCNSLQEHSSAGSGAKTCLLNDMTSGGESDRKNKTSLSNLSRDSGLTASDTQLYSPDRDQDHESVPEEEKMLFSLPASAASEVAEVASAAVTASASPSTGSSNACCYERKKSGSPSGSSAGGSSISLNRKKNKLLNSINNHNNNNNSSKCVNRVLSSSIPHLNTDELESMLNGTFSYGKSIGTGINGSCQDVVRNRKRHQVLQSTPVPQLHHVQVHYDDHQHPLIHQSSSHRNLKCRSSLVTLENCPPCPSFTNMNHHAHNHQHHYSHLNHQQQHRNHHHHNNHLNNCVNRFFSKSVPHLNSIGFRNSVTFSPSPRRATRVNLHGWSYDVSDAQRHNQSFPNDHYQPLAQDPTDKCMYRCRATPHFISYGSQQQQLNQPSTPSTGYTRTAAGGGGAGGPITGHISNSITVNGKRLHSISCLPSQCSYSPYGTVCPPSYQETMDRKKFVARLQSNVSLFRKISFDGVYEQFELRL